MRVALRERPAPGGRLRSHRALVAGAILVVCVIVAAGVGGPARFSGPRWAPSVSIARVHTRRPPPPPTAAGRRAPSTRLSAWVVAASLAAVAVALLAVAAWWWRRHRLGRRSAGASARSRPEVAALLRVPAGPKPDVPAVRDGIESALRALEDPREPADAIVRAWLGLTETAERSGITRGPAETPSEFTTGSSAARWATTGRSGRSCACTSGRASAITR